MAESISEIIFKGRKPARLIAIFIQLPTGNSYCFTSMPGQSYALLLVLAASFLQAATSHDKAKFSTNEKQTA